MKKSVCCLLAGLVFFAAGTVRAGGFENWCATYGVVADQEGDPDADGKDNLLEYAYNGDPTNSAITGTVPEMRLVEDGGTYYVEIERLELRNQDPADNWTFYAISMSDNLEEGMWYVALCTEVSRSQHLLTNYDQVVLRTAIPDSGGWTPSLLYYRGTGSGIYAYMGGVYAGRIGKTHYAYPFAEEAPRMIDDVLSASSWEYLKITERDGTSTRVDWDSSAGQWSDPMQKLPQAGYGFTAYRTEDADFFPNWFGKVIPLESVGIYCPKGETLIANPYPAQCTLSQLVSDPSDGDMVGMWDDYSSSYTYYFYQDGFPPYIPAGWSLHSAYGDPVDADSICIEPWVSVLYTTAEPKVLTTQAPWNEYFQGSEDQTFLALSEREVSCTYGTTNTYFEVYSIGGSASLSYTISNEASWISCEIPTGTTAGEHDTIHLTIDTSGLETGVHTGFVNVASSEAANGSQRIPVTIEVIDFELDSVAISGPTSVINGSTNQYACTAHYTDGSQSNKPASVQWSVSGTAASIDSSGRLVADNVEIQELITVSASYSEEGITKSNLMEVTVQNPNLHMDYSRAGTGSQYLILSNQVYFGTSGNHAAQIQNHAGLSVYNCSFEGGFDGNGLLIKYTDSVYLTNSSIQGGQGGSDSGDNALANGAHGMAISSSSTSQYVLNGTVVQGGSAGTVTTSYEYGINQTASALGGNALDISGTDYSVEINGGQYSGGAGSMYSDNSSYDEVNFSGGHGVFAAAGDNLHIKDGIFKGGQAGFANSMGSGSAANGGCGVYVLGVPTVISTGKFVGGNGGLSYGQFPVSGDGLRIENSSVSITNGLFYGGSVYAGYGGVELLRGAGLRLTQSSATIMGGVFADHDPVSEPDGDYYGASLILESSSANLYGGQFSRVLFSETGSSSIDVFGPVSIWGVTSEVSAASLTIKSGGILSLGDGQAQVPSFTAESGSRLSTLLASSAPIVGDDLVFESSCSWVVDAGTASVDHAILLATATNSLSHAFIPSDILVTGSNAVPVVQVYSVQEDGVYKLYVQLEVAPSYTAWSETITNTSLRGYTDCPDDDGVANLFKYACGLPSGNYANNLYSYTAVPGTPTNSAMLMITYKKAKGVSDASVYPQHTGSLTGDGSQWITNGITLQKTSETAEQETWEAHLPFTTNGYLRLKAVIVSEP